MDQQQASLPKGWLRKIGAIVGFTAFANIFLFHAFGSLGFVFVTAGMFLFLVAVFYRQLIERYNTLMFSGFCTFLIAASVAIVSTANSFISFVLVMAIFFALQLFAYLLYHNVPFIRSLTEFIVEPIDFTFAYIEKGFKVLNLITDSKLLLWRRHRVLQTVGIGLAVGIPLAFILIVLFTMADPIFGYFVKNLFSGRVPHDITVRVIYSLCITGILLPFLLLTQGKRLHQPIKIPFAFPLGNAMSIVMALVVVVVGTFLIIEWPYIFVQVAAETDLSKFGVATYSEYVKRGFIELLQIALILYGVLWAGLLAHRQMQGQKNILPFIQSALFFEFALFILSIFRRIWLYQWYHGWSLVRIYGGFFLLWIALMVITLAGRHVWKKRWIVAEIIMTAMLILFIGLFRAEHFIAVTNPPTVNGRVDYVYLSRLSSDGYPGWTQSFLHAQAILFNPMFIRKPMLNRDDRREIAYAGMIVKALTKRYNRLAQLYGTASEQEAYGMVKNRFDPTDKLFMWNTSEAQAYQQMKIEIPLSQLLELQRSYESFTAKIDRQPASEQGYDADISFDAPFLGPL